MKKKEHFSVKVHIKQKWSELCRPVCVMSNNDAFDILDIEYRMTSTFHKFKRNIRDLFIPQTGSNRSFSDSSIVNMFRPASLLKNIFLSSLYLV